MEKNITRVVLVFLHIKEGRKEKKIIKLIFFFNEASLYQYFHLP